MVRLKLGILLSILVLGFALRLYRFDSPLADWHSWRQSDTSSVSRNFVEKGFNVLLPTYHDLSNVPSGKDNPHGYRLVEFPVFNVLQAGAFSIFGFLTLEQWGRLVSIIASLFSTILIYLIVRKYQSEISAIISAFLFATLPFSVYWGRAILPDSLAIAFILSATYFFSSWIDNQNKKLSLTLSAIFFALAFLTRPFTLFLTLPAVFLAFNKFGLAMFRNKYLWLIALGSLLPLGIWRNFIFQHPEGVPASDWLFNAAGIRFKGAFFYWLFADRIGRLILGYWGLVLLSCGFLVKAKKENYLFFLSFALSSLIYLTVIAGGNVQHDYYQILILPALAIFAGLGGEFLIKNTRELGRQLAGKALFVLSLVFCLLFGWYFIRDYYNINNPSIVKAGAEIDKLIPENAKIIAEYGGDTTFLYQTKRSGWASFEKSIPEMVKLGADYLALPNPNNEDLNFSKDYKLIKLTSEYALFNLRQKP